MTAAPEVEHLPDWSSVAALLRRLRGQGVWRYEVRTGQITCSDEAIQLLGLPTGSPLDLASLKHALTTDQRAALEKAVHRTLDSGEKFEFDYRDRGKDGQERWLRACGTLVKIEGAEHIIGSLEDVTKDSRALETISAQAHELQTLKDQLVAENKRFRELFDQAPVFVALGSTPDLRFEYANRAYRALVGNRPLVGKTVSEALPEVVAQGLVAVLMHVHETGKPYTAVDAPTELYDGPDGSPRLRYLTYIYQPIRGGGADEVTGVLCVGYDVTEQHVAKEEAERLRDELVRSSHLSAMGTMAATLAHELNQPLTALVVFAGGLARHLGDTVGPQALQAIDSIKEEAFRASEIMRRMRAVASGHPIQLNPIELNEVFEDVLKSPLSPCKDVEVGMDLQHTGFAIGDKVQVQQVVLNMLRNACEAMHRSETKQVQIITKDRADEVLVCISDTGPGIPADLLPKMFDATESAKEGGMGIGLAICRTIVEAHGGRVGVDNREGGGATFWFTLRRHLDPVGGSSVVAG